MRLQRQTFTTATLVFCLALLAVSAMAQTITTGSIEGAVVDINGAMVPGVTVTVTSPNLILPQSALTDEEGRYHILNLPPGKYKITIEATRGFARFEQRDIEVNLSKTSEVPVVLESQQVSANLVVADIAGAPIDVNSNTTGTNVSTDQFSNFPTQRTIQSLYNIAPTVSRSGLRDQMGRDRDPSVAGSSGPENSYILDGVNVTDPAFGGSGSNLPFEFVQEVEIKTGAFGAEYGLSTGGIFNVLTKSGGNEFRGDLFSYFTTRGLVRETRNFPFTGTAPNGFSELDVGGDVGGPIKKDKLWFFVAFNPQRRDNFFLTQTFRKSVESKVTTPFYAGKLTYALNKNNVFTFSTFGDFTDQEGFLFGRSGFGVDPNSFRGRIETGGHNYALRLNSSITPNWIGEFTLGLHFQLNNVIPEQGSADLPRVTDNFAILRADGTVAPVTQSGVLFSPAAGQGANTTGFLDYVFAPGGTLQRGFVRQGFGQFSTQDRNRYEAAARLQNIWGAHTFKYGVEFYRNFYDINQRPNGPSLRFGNPLGLRMDNPDNNAVDGFTVGNNFSVCTTRIINGVNTIVCPAAAAAANRVAQLIAAGAVPGFTASRTAPITAAESSNNPFLIRLGTRVNYITVAAETYTDVESFYIQDDYKISRNVQVSAGLRWDFQQSYGDGGKPYLSLNNFKDSLQPRVGLLWDFTRAGKGKVFINYARFIETPIPLDINARAGSEDTGDFKIFNVNRYSAPAGSTIVPGVDPSGSLTVGALDQVGHPTPIDPDLKPQSVSELTAGIEYEIIKDLALGFRGIYRPQGTVIEDGSFDEGLTYFIFNPGESLTDRLSREPPILDAAGRRIGGGVGAGFGRARRYYRALEVTATKRFTNNYQFVASYVFSSLIGNYEGLFRNDNGQSDPNITSLFDLVSLLANLYGRLPNDRPHQFKFNGSYQTPWKLLISGNFYAQSGIPLSQLIPHVLYGNNEGFGVPRGTAVAPADAPGGIRAGRNRTPTTWNMDFGVYYPIKLGENRQLRLQLDWFNVFDNQRAVRQDETFLITSGIVGVPPVPNPFYGTGTIFQYPSSLRLGVKFQF
ncbi:MAG: carboxypeptidase regulatory-like domain-containing protein [Acidobacteriota bacterium]